MAGYASYFYADRSYLAERQNEPLDFIGFTEDVAHLPTAQHTIRAAGNRHRMPLRANTLPARLAAVRAGLGVGLLPKFVTHQYSELVAVDVGVEPLVRELWLAAHPDVRGVARLRIAFDHLASAIAGARDVLM
jgi:DNA-binding transcriptional LysR family regulator